MATGGNNDTEDSSYMSVFGHTSISSREPNSLSIGNRETTDLNAIKTMNKNLNEKIKILKKKIADQTKDYNAEKMELIRSHRREIQKFQEKSLVRLSEKSQEITKQAEEINRMKTTIESLERTEKELRDIIEKARRDGKNKLEYEEQMRVMTDSSNEIRTLREQIVILEKTIAEKDKEISKENKRNDDLSVEFGNLARKHEEDMTAMKDDLLREIEARDTSTKERLKEIKELIVADKTTNVEEKKQPNLSQTPLPPIKKTQPQSRQQRHDSNHWKY